MGLMEANLSKSMLNIDVSLTEHAYATLRRELITCRLEPGSRINMSSILTQFSLSQAAVREALSRLSGEGLVQTERNRGFLVAPVSLGGYRHLVQATLIVEMPCLRASVENGNIEWELKLVSVYHRGLRTLELVAAGKEGVDAYARERQNFYEALLAACDNPFLLRAWRQLYVENLRYRHLYQPLAEFELELNPQHAAVLEAVLARDTEKVTALSIQNYEQIMRFVESKSAEVASRPKRGRRPIR
jgi:GntR family carbon starvation induced transcriptional regulator